MGLCSYYRQYIESFSHIAAPLTRLTKKNVKFTWDESCQIAFETLKEKLCSSPVLAYPKPGLKYILDTDASDVGIDAVLSQVQDGKERVIAYASKKLNAQQQRYSVTRRELLAVITFMNYFRHFLLGQKFLLRTDHSLGWIFEFKDPRGQVARWLEILAQYDFEIQHRPGNKHSNADSLSRRDYEKSSCTHATTDVDNCTECQNQKREWGEFLTEVDNVVDLGMSVTKDQCRNLVMSNSYNVRAFTHRQAKEMAQTREPLRHTADQELPTNREITPEAMFLPSYSYNDIQLLQRQDQDLEIVHSWLDRKCLPTRDEVAQSSFVLMEERHQDWDAAGVTSTEPWTESQKKIKQLADENERLIKEINELKKINDVMSAEMLEPNVSVFSGSALSGFEAAWEEETRRRPASALFPDPPQRLQSSVSVPDSNHHLTRNHVREYIERYSRKQRDRT